MEYHLSKSCDSISYKNDIPTTIRSTPTRYTTSPMALAIVLPQIPNHSDDVALAHGDDEGYAKTLTLYNHLLETLPKGKGWMSEHLLKYNHFWLTPSHALKGTLLAQHHFRPNPTDLFLASFPKSGTTWLRSLMFSIINRHSFHITNHPLLTTNPHDCFPFLEAHVCANYITHLDDGGDATDRGGTSSSMFPSNDLYATHIPFSLLPVSVRDCCKTVYVSRDPKDVFISKWYFMSKLRSKQLPPLTLEDAFELFCDGVSHYGPYWNHALEYWKASLEQPDKVMFMKYEDIMREPSVQVKRLAHFMGQPFTEAEESDGKIEGIIRLCSFEHLSKLDVNTITSNPRAANFDVQNKHFFRKGIVGDGKNKLSPQMIHRLDQITNQKLLATGLSFQC